LLFALPLRSIAVVPPAPALTVPSLISETYQGWVNPWNAAAPLPPSIRPPLLLVTVAQMETPPKPRIAAPPVVRSAFDPPRIVPLLTMNEAPPVPRV